MAAGAAAGVAGGGGAAQLNNKISGAGRMEDILVLVTGGVKLNFIHVSNAMNKLARVAKRGTDERSWKLEGNRLRQDPRFPKLIDLVRAQCPRFDARGGANVLHALGVLDADLGAAAVDGELTAHLGEFVGRNAGDMNPQNVSNSLNALSKLEAAAAAVSPTGWAGLAEAAERTAREMNPQNVSNSLTALSKLEAAAATVSPTGWAGLAEAVERTAREMNEQNVSNTLYALGVLPGAAAELSPSARKLLEAAAEREFPNMTSEGRKMTLRGCEKLKLKTPSTFLK